MRSGCSSPRIRPAYGRLCQAFRGVGKWRGIRLFSFFADALTLDDVFLRLVYFDTLALRLSIYTMDSGLSFAILLTLHWRGGGLFFRRDKQF